MQKNESANAQMLDPSISTSGRDHECHKNNRRAKTQDVQAEKTDRSKQRYKRHTYTTSKVGGNKNLDTEIILYLANDFDRVIGREMSVLYIHKTSD